MPSPFEAAGANHEGSDYAPLVTDEYFTGMVTNRNPLRDANVPYVERKAFQAGRFDSIWDGLNMELSSGLTLIRRPGNSVYNSQTFAPIGRFYDFRTQVDGLDVIRVMVDTAAAVFDGTGPAGKTLVWQKSAGSGKTSFLSVGNTLYMGNGVDQIKWTISTRSYKSLTVYKAGQFINDPNGNIQVAFGFAQANVIDSAIIAPPHPIGTPPVRIKLVLTLDGPSPFIDEQPVSLAGLGLAAEANGLTLPVTNSGPNTIYFILPFVPTPWAAGPDTGIAYANGSGSGISGTTGAVAPAWATTIGASTVDGTVIWINKGPAVEKWGTAAPTVAPTINQAVAQSPYPDWAASTFYSPNLVSYNAADPTTFAQLTIDGITGAAEPTFDPVPGHTTVDGTATWTTFKSAWTAATARGLGELTVASVAGVLTVFQVVLQGITGAAAPFWVGPFGAQINDGSLVWQNIGPALEWTTIGATVPVTIAQAILDSGGFIQQIQVAGISGAAPPTWNETLSGLTVDNAATWQNGGGYATAGTAPTKYAFSFQSSVTFTESNVSPIASFTLREGHRAVLQGPGSADPQIDTIRIYRTLQGGSTLIFVGFLPAPLAGAQGIWTFVDNLSELDLAANFQIQGAIDRMNDPPPLGLINLTYHMGRIWGSVATLQYFCTGPDATVGNGNEAWSPSNVFAMPDAIARSVPWDLPDGALLVFTASSTFAIWGTGQASKPFYPKSFTQGSGLLSWDALEVASPWVHMFSTDQRVVSFKPTAGYTQDLPDDDDSGHAIGDQFVKVTTGGINAALYTPQGTYLSWHSFGTNDTGLIVADGSVGWFRYSPIGKPENGSLWSPRAAIEGGTSAVQSIETSPGIQDLLIGGVAKETLAISQITITLGFVAFNFAGVSAPAIGKKYELVGLTTCAYLNGLTLTVTSSGAGTVEGTVNHAPFPDFAATPETGTLILGSPILKRDATLNSDNGVPYAETYATIGSIQLAQPGEVSEVADIMLDSKRVGTAPTVAVLLGEIAATAEVAFVALERTSVDPPLLAPSQTLFNDRFSMLQNSKPTMCRHMQLKIQLTAEDAPSEILTHTIYGRRMPERKVPAA